MFLLSYNILITSAIILLFFRFLFSPFTSVPVFSHLLDCYSNGADFLKIQAAPALFLFIPTV